jgi:hypothetical protein
VLSAAIIMRRFLQVANGRSLSMTVFDSDEYSNVLKRPLHSTEDLEELPPSWFGPPDPIAPETHLTAPSRVAEVNRYGVHAGQGLREWEKSGWIWEGDPRGWMQWYTRFYYGRRCPDDVRQVQRCGCDSVSRIGAGAHHLVFSASARFRAQSCWPQGTVRSLADEEGRTVSGRRGNDSREHGITRRGGGEGFAAGEPPMGMAAQPWGVAAETFTVKITYRDI